MKKNKNIQFIKLAAIAVTALTTSLSAHSWSGVTPADEAIQAFNEKIISPLVDSLDEHKSFFGLGSNLADPAEAAKQIRIDELRSENRMLVKKIKIINDVMINKGFEKKFITAQYTADAVLIGLPLANLLSQATRLRHGKALTNAIWFALVGLTAGGSDLFVNNEERTFTSKLFELNESQLKNNLDLLTNGYLANKEELSELMKIN